MLQNVSKCLHIEKHDAEERGSSVIYLETKENKVVMHSFINLHILQKKRKKEMMDFIVNIHLKVENQDLSWFALL